LYVRWCWVRCTGPALCAFLRTFRRFLPCRTFSTRHLNRCVSSNSWWFFAFVFTFFDITGCVALGYQLGLARFH
jgi:hypothetical protein